MNQSTLAPNREIAGYSLIERIGEGGYGEVWRAEGPGGLHKAVKIVFGRMDEERAMRERKALERIREVRHPFLLSLERIEVSDSQLVIVTELADQSLKDRFEECRRKNLPGVPREELIVYMQDAAEALDYMSDRYSLQHLDVKPENLLLLSGRVKVADFGLVKDLHEVSMSLMGGLTPLYAPPEVFDAQPCSHSDQYSLAIVYQEMLTGMVPFPGRTPAQLASQHIHSPPNLEALPRHDRAVVAIALAKDPQRRFSNCREMVQALKLDEAAVSSSSSLATRNQQGDTTARGGQVTSVSPATTAKKHAAGSKRHFAPKPLPVRVKTMPPLQLPEVIYAPRPTLFVGLGGGAAEILQGLRSRFVDRFRQQDAMPAAIQFLLVDTDSRSLAQQSNHGFLPHELLSMPLRRPHEYRESTPNLLSWLGRRWLYNIPKSQQTDGLRPLGRLALVDHAPQFQQRLDQAWEKLIGPESDAPLQETNTSFSGPPRLVLVAGVGGGTGGGMALDVAYFLKAMASRLVGAEVFGTFAFWTPRQTAARDLARANGLAVLRELRHYVLQGYSGDAACRLSPLAGPPFHGLHVAEIGENLSDEELRGAFDQLAELLFLDSVTPAAQFFAACRREEPPTPGISLRSVAVCQLGGSQHRLSKALVEGMLFETLQAWRGEDPKPQRVVLPGKEEPAKSPAEMALDAELVASENSIAHRWEQAQEQLYSAADHALSSGIEAWALKLLEHFIPSANDVTAEKIAECVESIDHSFSTRYSDSAVPMALLEESNKLAEKLGSELAQRVLNVTIGGSDLSVASRVCLGIADQLSERERVSREKLRQLNAQRIALRKNLGLSEDSPATPASKIRVKTADIPGSLVDYATLRYHGAVLQSVCGFAQKSGASLSPLLERISNGRRALNGEIQKYADWETAIREAPPPRSLADQLQAEAAAKLTGSISELARRLRDDLKSSQQFPGAVEFVLKDVPLRQLLVQIQNAANVLIKKALEYFDISAAFSKGSGENQPDLEKCIAKALPRLLECGGTARWLLVTPARSRSEAFQEEISRQLNIAPNVVHDAGGHTAICCEVGNVPLVNIEARWSEGREDLIEAASRLQVRKDIDWID